MAVIRAALADFVTVAATSLERATPPSALAVVVATADAVAAAPVAEDAATTLALACTSATWNG
jgi:hypothetical protein